MRKAEKLFFPSAIVPEIEKQKKHSFRTFSIFIGDSSIVLKKQWTTSACDNLGIFNHSIDEKQSFSASRHNEMRFCSRTNFYFLSLKVFPFSSCGCLHYRFGNTGTGLIELNEFSMKYGSAF